MKKISLAKASSYTSPNPVTVVCTTKADGSPNLATVSWWTYLSYSPNMVAYAMAKTSYSGEMMRANKRAVITIPSDKITAAVLGCGMTTGRNTDKPEKFGIDFARRLRYQDTRAQLSCDRMRVERIFGSGGPLPLHLQCQASICKRRRKSIVCLGRLCRLACGKGLM